MENLSRGCLHRMASRVIVPAQRLRRVDLCKRLIHSMVRMVHCRATIRTSRKMDANCREFVGMDDARDSSLVINQRSARTFKLSQILLS